VWSDDAAASSTGLQVGGSPGSLAAQINQEDVVLNRWKMLGLSFLAACGAAHAALPVPSGAYVLENTHGYITYSYSHLGFSRPQVGFNTFTVDLDLNAEDPSKSTVKVGIDTASVDSRVPDFDKHLVGDKFFDAAKYPTITFESTAVQMTSDTTATVSGNLTLKGVTRPVTLEATLNKAAEHPMRKVPTLGLIATAKVLRSEFGLGEYVPMVGDEVEITISVELVKKP